MNSPVLRDLLRPAMFVNSMLWFAFTSSIIIYGLVAYLLVPSSQAPTEIAAVLQLSLAAVAVLTGFGSLLLPRVLLSDDRLRAAMRADPDPESLARHPRLGTVDEERLRKIQSLSDAERRLLQLHGRYVSLLIVRLAMNEAIAIYGLVLAFVSHSFASLLPFAAAAVVLNLTCLPRIEPVLERAARFMH